ncbi:OmpA family protein (plasmid) [Spirosoma sp. SC4-14]|uniref:OmpA family protein n=1 Tax=Spirosoma sp. SC4-14 TaxID=3128900 RepID=UPI0030D521CC
MKLSSRICILRTTGRLLLVWCCLGWLNAVIVNAQASIKKPGEIQQPKGNWQKPGEIQQPKGNWQKPGEIQVPRGIQAIRVDDKTCLHRLSLVADALFDFDQATLSSQAEETLQALIPLLAREGKHVLLIEGHTDAIGSSDYNMALSRKRAQAVSDWLATHQSLPPGSAIKGYGETRPVAANKKPDGSDDPVGRQKNRRVDLVIDTCH